jgi:nitroimidazol reductase NimA-like FMN-containing flavoprotein (pyridoxamine 5'-phosphate oxidase superfamily)
MEFDRNGLEVLTREQCLKLMSSTRLGRIGVTMGGLPVILPVAFAVTRRGIVIRTGLGTKLAAAARNAVVAFEVDVIDEATRSGWSATVTGFAREVTDREELAELDTLVLVPWIGVQKAPHYVVIDTEVITGRRLSAWNRAEVAAS